MPDGDGNASGSPPRVGKGEGSRHLALAEGAGDYGGKQVSSAKAAREIGWTPKVDFATGMERTVQWFMEQERVALRSA